MGCSSGRLSIVPLGRGSRKRVLGSLDLNGVAEYILSGKCRNVVWLSGAGISVSAGIPDFRSKAGLYSSLSRYNLPSPECIFDIEYFYRNPRPFYDLARRLYPGRHKPTATHHFIQLLHSKGLLLRNWTQNIDMLERLAGLPARAVVNAHGSFEDANCSRCGRLSDAVVVKRKIMKNEEPRCHKCGGHLKPAITFFGEPLPERVTKLARQDFKACDLLIVAGTSLAVQPVAGFIQKIPRSTPRLLCNRVIVGVKEMCDNSDSLTDGFLFGRDDNYRDVVQLGDCDETVLRLASLLGWSQELNRLIKSFSLTAAAQTMNCAGRT